MPPLAMIGWVAVKQPMPSPTFSHSGDDQTYGEHTDGIDSLPILVGVRHDGGIGVQR